MTREKSLFRRRVAGAAWRIRRRFPGTVRSGAGEGLRIGLRGASADYRSGRNEIPVQEFIASNLSPGDVFYDVGSNVGFFALIAARIVGEQGAVHAFEAMPTLAREISHNARRNKLANVSVHAIAVGESMGTITLMQARHPGGATTSVADAPDDVVGSIEVPCTTIDAFVGSPGVAKPDLVKIDVEGAEPEVITGMENVLREHRPIVVYELDDRDRTRLDEKLERMSSTLARLGYDTELLPDAYTGHGWHVAHVAARPAEH